ncbi:MAG: hypothetical protein WA823_19780, partial [Candidatus Acidiferrales bacterium]
YPLASLLATEQVSLGDVISIDWNGSETGLMFLKEAEGALIPIVARLTERAKQAAAAAISDARSMPTNSARAIAERLPPRPGR